MFADLVKAFDTSNHKLMVAILKKYGCPPKLCSAIRRMYTDNNVRLILGKIDLSIPFEVGVKQGDSVAPVLFLFIMMAFAETLEEEWVKNNLNMIQFRRKSNSPQSSGRVTSHPAKTFSQGILFELFCMLYVDDGAFAFETRREMEIGANLIYKHFAKFGLEMHVGTKSKKSKTECVFFPAPCHFKILTLPPTAPPADSSSLPVIPKPKKENEETKQKRQDQRYDDAEETRPIRVGETGIITFTRDFKYLGSYISYSLRDDYDIEHRISQASAAMGALNNFWSDDSVDNFSKYLIFCAIPLNLLLWGCESWAIREATLQKLEVFLHRSIRKILNITIQMVIDEKITNKMVRGRFFEIPTIRFNLARRQLTFIGKVVRNSDDQIPTQLLTAWCNNKRKPGAPLQNNKKNLAQNIRLIVPGAAKDGLLSSWVYLALDDGYWAHLVSQLGSNPSRWTGTEPNPRSTPPPRSSRRNNTSPPTPPRRPVPPNSPPPSRTRNTQHTPTPPRRNAPQPSPRRQASPRQEESSRRNQRDQRNYDPAKVGHTKRDSLGILNIPMSATEREIKVQYRRLARIYHPDKYDPTITEMSMFEAQEHFKQINNAYEYLRT
jgi:hypothetical protein